MDIEKAINQQPSKLESKILKAIFKNNQAILDIIDIIDTKSFTIGEYASIYEAMVDIYKHDDTITPESVELWLANHGYTINSDIIKKLYNESYTSIKIKKTAEILKELYQRRQMLVSIRNILDQEEEKPSSSDKILEKINNMAMKSNDIVSATEKNTKCCDDINSFMADLDTKLTQKIEDDSMKVGINTIDNELGGLKRGKLWVVVADSQVGKSALAVQLAVESMLRNPNINVSYYSLEMDKEECTQRALANITDIQPNHIEDPRKYFIKFDKATSTYRDYYKEDKDGPMVKEFKRTLKEGAQKLNSFNFHIDDSADLDIVSLEARVKKNNLKWGHTDLIIIDHMNILCNGTPSEVVGLMDLAYGKLKQMAKKLNCTVIALHQFGKELASDPQRFPNIFSLRGSSAPRHYADVICGIYRPCVYPELIKTNPDLKDVCQLIWQKVRYTAKPDITNCVYNGYRFEEKPPSELTGKILSGKTFLDLDGNLEVDEDE